jgi:hypothetical protein
MHVFAVNQKRIDVENDTLLVLVASTIVQPTVPRLLHRKVCENVGLELLLQAFFTAAL